MGPSVGRPSGCDERRVELRFVHRFCGSSSAGGPPICSLFDVAIFADGAWSFATDASARIRAGARFLIDTAYGRIEPTELARMIGCFVFACTTIAEQRALDVTIRNDRSLITAARVHRSAFPVERHAYGAAHILYENTALGLYVLEVAPGASIPAHFHRVMEESELVLDDGLLQQGCPVRAGDAFVWPAGLVHEYSNPTDGSKRILCIDKPKFFPEDEVVVTGTPELVPVAPGRNYLV